MKKETIRIAIDGPAAAGKSTVAKLVAQHLEIVYIDTGAMYRALTWKALQQKTDLNDDLALEKLLIPTVIKLEQVTAGQRVLLDGMDVTEEIRTEQVTNNVSYVAKYPVIRKIMVERQQELADNSSVVMDGRDIGTHVIPDAEVKIFLHATVDERAKRRYEENVQKGFPTDLVQLKREIEERDSLDSRRKAAPLVKAKDAVEIDTTSLTIEEVAQRILEEVDKIAGN